MEKTSNIPLKLGRISAMLLPLLTLFTFALAISAVPISGPFCPEECIEYPYLETAGQWPGDYLWMFPAMLMLLVYLFLFGAVHEQAPEGRRLYSRMSFSFALMAAGILVTNYFVQVSVVPVSLMSGETKGIALLTQYNPHGLFIALEEAGYLLMSFSFLFLALVFNKGDRWRRAMRWVGTVTFFSTFTVLVIISLQHGLERSYRFEIWVISINWMALILSGILMWIILKKEWR